VGFDDGGCLHENQPDVGARHTALAEHRVANSAVWRKELFFSRNGRAYARVRIANFPPVATVMAGVMAAAPEGWIFRRASPGGGCGRGRRAGRVTAAATACGTA
jgi:hypothetical protein